MKKVNAKDAIIDYVIRVGDKRIKGRKEIRGFMTALTKQKAVPATVETAFMKGLQDVFGVAVRDVS